MAAIIGPCMAFVITVVVQIASGNNRIFGQGPPQQECEDNAPNCNEFEVANLCTDPVYTDWVLKFCKLSCQKCGVKPVDHSTTHKVTVRTTTPVIDPTCFDKVNNCNEYQGDTCTNPDFAGWAREHCSHYCNFCQGHTTTPQPTTTETPHPGGLVCFDRIDCEEYDVKTACCGDYEPWARHHCARFCKFCEPVITVTPLCDDTDSKCKDYGSDLCTNPKYDRFIREHCAGTCKDCDQPEYIPQCALPSSVTSQVTSAPTTGVLTTSAPGACEDLLDCKQYDIRTSCCGPYEPWAKHHCAKHCKFCVPDKPETPLCHDIDTKCDQYGTDLCTDPQYDRYIHENCAGTCNVCSRPTYIPPCTDTTSPPVQNHDCVKDFKSYPQGHSWETTDCQQDCTCVDGPTNNIKCESLV